MTNHLVNSTKELRCKLGIPFYLIAVSWLMSLFLLAPLLEWFSFLVALLAIMIVPIFALGAWLAGVPVWLLGLTFIKIYRKQWHEAVRCFAILPLGAAIAFAGFKCGDLIAVMTYGPLLKNEVEAVRAGAPAKASNGVFSSSTMAFKLTGGFLDISEGIVYDSSGQAGRMLPLTPSARPRQWQKNAVDVLSCRGSARHLFGDFYKVVVSDSSC